MTSSGIQKQKAIYKKTIKIYGPPGTGKTYTLIERILKRYLAKGVHPSEIAYISFTNKAVNEAIERAINTFPNFDIKDFERFKTLHKYCRRYFEEEVFDPKNCMIDFALQTKIIKNSDTRLSDDGFIYKDWSLGVYDKSRNTMQDPILTYKKETYKKDSLDVYCRKISTYEHYKKDSFIDFTDMISRAIDEVDFPKLKLLILDEAQDFTPLQWSLIYKMVDSVERVVIAGDDDQSIYGWNGSDHKYFTTYFPGRKVILRKTKRFGEAIYQFSQIIRRGIMNSLDKEYYPSDKDGYVKRYLNFREVPLNLEGTWYILGRVNSVVNELRMMAKDAGLYFADNRGNKSFDNKQWEAIKSWTKISKGKSITKHEAENMFKYIRELKDSSYRSVKFWVSLPDTQEYDFDGLIDWCGLELSDEAYNKPWYEILKRNFHTPQITYFVRLLQRYGQKALNGDPQIIIDTIHSVKGGQADNVLIFSKTNWVSSFSRKNPQEQSEERKVYYVGVTRAKKRLHLLGTDYRYNYPMGVDYLDYLREKK
jgi:superfamily I DNA/RNA helicase